jgi:hypothetical protein
METIKMVEFDPISIKGTEFELRGRVTLSNGEVRDASGAGPWFGSKEDQERRAQGMILMQIANVLCGVKQ